MNSNEGQVPAAAILGCEGLSLGKDEAAFFRAADPFGFVLFARNVEKPEQLKRLTADLRESVGRNVPVLIDQEGGRVQRLRGPYWREWMAPLDQMAASLKGGASRGIWLRYRLIAEELRAVGIDANCAPTADIAGPQTHEFLRNRCLGETADAVTDGARAAALGLLAGGVLPVIKHMPGHGRAEVDSHLSVPKVDASLRELAQTDFAPFRALANLPMAMTAHVIYSAIDPDRPATTSARMVDVIRDDIGFEGFLMTDDISMQALSGDIGSRTKAAIAARCDAVLHCNGNLAEMEQVVANCGALRPAARERAAIALGRRRMPEPVDMDALEAELRSLVRVPEDG